MKIALLAAAATSFLHLKDPSTSAFLYEDGEPVGIDLFGPGSPEASVVEERIGARTTKRIADNDNKVVAVPLAQRRSEGAEDLADVTAGFRHIEHDGPDGAPLVGRALYMAVYSDPKLGWIREQAVKHQADWGKFTPASSGR